MVLRDGIWKLFAVAVVSLFMVSSGLGVLVNSSENETIQGAIDSSSAPVVKVSQGMYNESLTVNRSVRITSVSGRPMIDSRGVTVNITAPDTVLEGFQVVTAGTGIRIAAENVTVRNNTVNISSKNSVGVQVSGSDAVVKDTNVHGNFSLSQVGFLVSNSDGGIPSNLTNLKVADSSAERTGIGILARMSQGMVFANVTFEDNVMENNGNGIVVGASKGFPRPKNVSFRGNVLRSNHIGIRVPNAKNFSQFDSSEVRFRGNVFSGNGRAVVNNNILSLDLKKNYWGGPEGLTRQDYTGDVEWRPYYPTEKTLESGDYFMSRRIFEKRDKWARDRWRTDSEINSAVTHPDVSVPSYSGLSREGARAVFRNMSDESDLRQTLEEQRKTIKDQRAEIQRQEREIDRMSRRLETVASGLNQTLDVMEAQGRAKVERSPTGFSISSSPGGGWLDGLVSWLPFTDTSGQ